MSRAAGRHVRYILAASFIKYLVENRYARFPSLQPAIRQDGLNCIECLKGGGASNYIFATYNRIVWKLVQYGMFSQVILSKES